MIPPIFGQNMTKLMISFEVPKDEFWERNYHFDLNQL